MQAAAVQVVERTPAEETLVRVRRNYAPPPKELVSEFSDQHIIVTSGPLQGTRWQTSFAPFQAEILDVFHEPGVNTAVVMGSSQWGKTAILVNQCGFRIARDQGPMMIVFPTVDPMARDFAKNRLEPVIAATPILSEVFGTKRSKDASNTTLLKTFPRGFIVVAGANSASSLAARTIRDLWCDEIERWPVELADEGNTLSIVLKRTQAYGRRARRMLSSSPKLKGGPIHDWFLRGDQRYYYVPCPKCRTMHTFEWKNVKWVNNDPQTAYLECPNAKCKHHIGEAERLAVLHHGEWRQHNPGRVDKSIVSFHMWEAYSPFSSLATIVKTFIAARIKQKAGDKSEMHTWQNTTLAQPVDPDKNDGPDPNALVLRREPYITDQVDVPAGACCLVLGVDTQDDWLDAHLWAYGPGEEAWLVNRHRFDGNTEQPQPWSKLDELLEWQFRHPTGHRLMIQSVCIDTAGHRTNVVYDWVERKGGTKVKAIIGRAGQRPFIGPPSMVPIKNTDRKVALYTVGVDSGKSILINRLKIAEKGPGYIHLPDRHWCDQEFAEQLTAEFKVIKWDRGIPVEVWRKRRPRNEGADNFVYSLAALRLLNPQLNQMKEYLWATAPSAPMEQQGRGERTVVKSDYIYGEG